MRNWNTDRFNVLVPELVTIYDQNLVLSLFFFLAAWHVGSYFPNQGSNPCPLQWKYGVLTTGPPGKSLSRFLIWPFFHGTAQPSIKWCKYVLLETVLSRRGPQIQFYLLSSMATLFMSFPRLFEAKQHQLWHWWHSLRTLSLRLFFPGLRNPPCHRPRLCWGPLSF